MRLTPQKTAPSRDAATALRASIAKVESLLAEGKCRTAEQRAAKLLKSAPGDLRLLYLRADAATGGQRHKVALAHCNRILAIEPGHAAALLLKCHNHEALYGRQGTVALLRDYLISHENRLVRRMLAQELIRLRQFSDALDCLQAQMEKAEAADIELVGLCLEEIAGAEAAAGAYELGMRLDPGFAANFLHRARLARLHDKADPRPYLNGALTAEPGNERALLGHLRASLDRCDWSTFERMRPAVHVLKQIGFGPNPPSPWMFLPLADDPETNLRRQQHRDTISLATSGLRDAAFAPLPARPRGDRIRIGYVSSDFHGHATMLLLAGVLREHDKSRFELHCFNYGQTDALFDESRRHFDAVHDLATCSNAEIAQRARDVGLDVAMDLKGDTQGSRPGLFLHGLAPVQINYLGYPNTMGSRAHDYLIGDRIVTPTSLERHFSEAIMRLPTCYLPNDDHRQSRGTGPDNSADLPEGAVVLASLNQPYKISREVFDIWMRALQAAPNAVLWLLEGPDDLLRNLREHAAAAGVGADRLIFARRLPFDQHIDRLARADLYLDTFHVNAHTLAAEALCAARIPLLTRQGRQFAARVAASFATHAGLPDLVATSSADYADKLVALATDPARLQAIRDQLNRTAASAPLFSSAAYTRMLERGLATAVQRRYDGLKPVSFDVAEESADA